MHTKYFQYKPVVIKRMLKKLQKNPFVSKENKQNFRLKQTKKRGQLATSSQNTFINDLLLGN